MTSVSNPSQDPFDKAAASASLPGINVVGWRENRFGAVRVFRGMPVVDILYSPRQRSIINVNGRDVDSLRQQGNVQKKEFLKWLASEHGDALKSDLRLTSGDIERMKTDGNPPTGYDVHHRMPLGGCQSFQIAEKANDFDNMVLISIAEEHAAIHEFLQKQIDLKPNSNQMLLRLPAPIGFWYKPLPNQWNLGNNDELYEELLNRLIAEKSAVGLAMAEARDFSQQKEIKKQKKLDYLEGNFEIAYTAKAKKIKRAIEKTNKSDLKENNTQNISDETVVKKFIKQIALENRETIKEEFKINDSEIDLMISKGKLPDKLKIYQAWPLNIFGYDVTTSFPAGKEQGGDLVLTTVGIKKEINRQLRKQTRNIKIGDGVNIIIPVFDKPWFSNKVSDKKSPDNIPPALSFVKLTENDLDIAALYKDLYVRPELEQKIDPQSKNNRKNRKNPPPNFYINANYVAVEITLKKKEALKSADNKREKRKRRDWEIKGKKKEESGGNVKAETDKTKITISKEDEFVKWVSLTFPNQLKIDLNLNALDIANMQTLGRLPKQFMVGRRIPLKGCGNPEIFEKFDHFDNMVILRVDHQARLNKQIKNQVSGANPGEVRLISIPVIPGYWAKLMSAEEINLRGEEIINRFQSMMVEQKSALGIAFEQAKNFPKPVVTDEQLSISHIAQTKVVFTDRYSKEKNENYLEEINQFNVLIRPKTVHLVENEKILLKEEVGFIKKLSKKYADELKRAFSLDDNDLYLMENYGKLPENLALFHRRCVINYNENGSVSIDQLPEKFILTTSQIKARLDSEIIEQTKDVRPFTKKMITLSSFKNPWFNGNTDEISNEQVSISCNRISRRSFLRDKKAQ